MTAQTHNRIALWLSLAALLSFGAFHFLKVFISGEPIENDGIPEFRGFELWQNLWNCLRHPAEIFKDPIQEIFVPTFAIAAIGFVATPFCIRTLSRSRMLWWAWLVIWAVAGIAQVWVWLLVFKDQSSQANGVFGIGPGLFFLTVALQLNLMALFFVRSSKPDESASFPAPA